MKTYLLLVIILLLTACSEKQTEESTGAAELQENQLTLDEEQIEMAGIVSGRPEEMILSDVLSCNGYVRVPPRSQVSVSLPVEAYVREIHFHWGEKIDRGKLLAVMEHPEFLKLQENYIETGNQLELLKADLERQVLLAEENAVSEKVLMTARTGYENNLARHASLGGQLKLLGIDPAGVSVDNLRSRVNVYAPISGYVAHHNIKTGELMHPGDPIAEIIDITKLNLHLVIYEKDISRVSAGQQVEFTTETEGQIYWGEVHTKGRTIDPGNRSVDIHVHIENPDDNLLAGMYVKAGILTGQSKVMAIPEEGVVTEAGKDYIFISQGNSFTKIAVGTGLRKDGFVEILSPESLPDKDLVVAGAYYLNAEMSSEEE
jgi:membrane fusion protein, heavy metal efflux system